MGKLGFHPLSIDAGRWEDGPGAMSVARGPVSAIAWRLAVWDETVAEEAMDDNVNLPLLDAYTRASNMWAVYQTTHDQNQLSAAGRVICDELTRLAANRGFWARVVNAAAHVDDNAPALATILADLGTFADASGAMLEAVIGDIDTVARLTSDLTNAVAIVNGYPRGEAISNLERTVAAFRDQVCRTIETPHASLRQRARLALRGASVLGGLFIVGVSIATLDATPPGLAGVIGGASMIGAQVNLLGDHRA